MQSVFARSYSTYEGESPSLYRSTEDIGRDIKEIKARIGEVYSMLNVRNVLGEAMSAYAGEEPECWIPALKNLVEEAEDTLGVLICLRDNLDILKAELEDTVWILGR